MVQSHFENSSTIIQKTEIFSPSSKRITLQPFCCYNLFRDAIYHYTAKILPEILKGNSYYKSCVNIDLPPTSRYASDLKRKLLASDLIKVNPLSKGTASKYLITDYGKEFISHYKEQLLATYNSL
jgi:predicted transcriptional regulator